MNSKTSKLLSVGLLFAWHGYGQGTFVYDQQSTNVIEGIGFINIVNQPMGQSFTPSLTAVAFVELNLYDAGSLPIGATVFINLRSNSVTGTLLGSSSAVTMPNDFFGITNFLFSVPVSVTPGVVYYFQPVVQTGDGWGSYVTDGSYTGGSQISSGVPVPGRNLWFREGINVPEPSALTLLFVGSAIGFWRARRKPVSKQWV